jgi:uncharacterized protein HemY
MTRDNLLFTVIGVLFGFISGYFLQEVISEHQPPRFPPAAVATGTPGGAPGGTSPAVPGGGTGPMPEIAQLMAYVAQNPNDADAVLTLANANYDIKNWSRAAELYQQYLALVPGSPDVLTDLGVATRQLGDFDQALGYFDQAQALAPQHFPSRFNEVVVLAFDLGDFAAARVLLTEMRTMQPGNADVERLAAEVERRAAAGA